MPSDPEITGPVLLFDGECNLCRRVVVRLHRMDRRGVLRFAPLQGRTAQAFLRARGLPTADFDSLILVPEWTNRATAPFLLQTDGALVALRATGGARCGLAALGGLFPAAWRDALYRRVAANRKRLGGPGMVALPAERMLP